MRSINVTIQATANKCESSQQTAGHAQFVILCPKKSLIHILFNYLIFINISGFKQCSLMMYEKFPRFHLRNTPSSLSGFNTWLKIIMPTGIFDRNNLRPIMGNGKWV